jgi:ABC-type transporter Mla subunit MlaD
MIKKHIFIFVIVILLINYLLYIICTTKVTICFEDFEPFKQHLKVYYNGFKLGHTTKIYPSNDFKATMVDTRLLMRKLELPANTYAVMRRRDKKDYIELEYPAAPYIEKLKNKDVIKGHMGVNFENFLQEQAEGGGLDEIKNNVNTTIVSAGQTFDALTQMLNVLTGILEDVRPSINDTVLNVNSASKSLAKVSVNLQKTVEKGYIDTTLLNLQETSGNLVLTTENFGGFSDSLNKKSTILTNCLLKNLNIVVCNMNEIIIGVGNTLKKRFGGLRLFFGKTIS